MYDKEKEIYTGKAVQPSGQGHWFWNRLSSKLFNRWFGFPICKVGCKGILPGRINMKI